MSAGKCIFIVMAIIYDVGQKPLIGVREPIMQICAQWEEIDGKEENHKNL